MTPCWPRGAPRRRVAVHAWPRAGERELGGRAAAWPPRAPAGPPGTTPGWWSGRPSTNAWERGRRRGPTSTPTAGGWRVPGSPPDRPDSGHAGCRGPVTARVDDGAVGPLASMTTGCAFAQATATSWRRRGRRPPRRRPPAARQRPARTPPTPPGPSQRPWRPWRGSLVGDDRVADRRRLRRSPRPRRPARGAPRERLRWDGVRQSTMGAPRRAVGPARRRPGSASVAGVRRAPRRTLSNRHGSGTPARRATSRPRGPAGRVARDVRFNPMLTLARESPSGRLRRSGRWAPDRRRPSSHTGGWHGPPARSSSARSSERGGGGIYAAVAAPTTPPPSVAAVRRQAPWTAMGLDRVDRPSLRLPLRFRCSPPSSPRRAPPRPCSSRGSA